MNRTPSQFGRQRGLTLVELMVALAISLVLVLAAAMLYLNTRSSQRSTDERTQLMETAQMAMQVIGRELGMAGFYPVASEETGPTGGADFSSVLLRYKDVVKLIHNNAPPAALATGVFGCEGQKVSTDLTGCAEAEDGADDSDALLVSYFTTDAFSYDVGLRGDCTRADVAKDSTHNPAARVGSYTSTDDKGVQKTVSRGLSDLGLPPLRPLLVINRYYLRSVSYVTEGGQEVRTQALACTGNGTNTNAGRTANLVNGVEQMTFTYGVFTDASRHPSLFLTADEVAELTDETIDGEDYSPWERVVAVRVCVLVRSFSNTELSASGVGLIDCNNEPYSPPAGVMVRRFTQTFGIKNRLTRVAGS